MTLKVFLQDYDELVSGLPGVSEKMLRMLKKWLVELELRRGGGTE